MTGTALHAITGGGGFLGTHLARTLLERGHRVRAFDQAAARALPAGVELVTGDVRDAAAVGRALEGANVVHHLAFVQSMSRLPEPVQRSVALDGTRTVLEVARARGVARCVFTSTIEVYGTRAPSPCPEDAPVAPVGLYGRLKWEAERLAFELGTRLGVEVVALRMPTICGPGAFNHRPLLSLLERARLGGLLAVAGRGDVRGDFVDVDDVAQAYALAAERPGAAGLAFNVASRAPATHEDLLAAIVSALGSRSRIVRVPRPVARALLPLGRLLGLTELPSEQDGYLFHDAVYAIDRARAVLGYEPRKSTVEAAAALARGYLAEREAVLARSRSY